MESTDDAQWVAMVAHDLRNPLAAIQGYASLLLEREWDAAQRGRTLKHILSASEFADRIVGQLLDLEAAERGLDPARLRWMSVPELLVPVLDGLQCAASRRGVVLSAATPLVFAPAWIEPVALRRVLENLIGNALRHVPAGTGAVEVRLSSSPDELLVRVCDNGCGIAPERLQRVFDRLHRGEGEAPGRSGLGLGLAIARTFVEAHGGRLWAESAGAGAGATFAFTLPRARRRPRRPGAGLPVRRALLGLAALAALVLAWATSPRRGTSNVEPLLAGAFHERLLDAPAARPCGGGKR